MPRTMLRADRRKSGRGRWARENAAWAGRSSSGSSVAAPTNSVAPVISGTATQGQTLTTTDGTWTGSPTFTYQWKRDGAAISSATASTYVLVAADAGASITCVVTGTNAGGATSATSNSLGPVLGFMQTALMMSTSTTGPSNTAARVSSLAVSPSTSGWQTGATGLAARVPMTIAGTFSNLYVRLPAALTGGQTWEFRLYKNGVSTGLFCTVTSDGLIANDNVDTVDVVAGDTVYIFSTPTGTPTAQTVVQISLLFTATNTTDGPLFCSWSSGSTAGFGAIGSMQSQGGTEATSSTVMVAAGDVSELRACCSVATGGVTTRILTLRKNGADTGLTVTITNGDGTNVVTATPTTVSYVAGDVISVSQTLSGAPAAATVQVGLNWKPTTVGQFMTLGNMAAALSTSATRYGALRGTVSGGSGSSTETDVYAVAPADMTLKALRASMSTAAGASKSRTFTVRKAGADTALTVAVDGAVEVEDSITTDVSVTAGQVIDISTTPAGTPAAVTWARTGVTAVVVPAANQVNFSVTDISGDVFDGYVGTGQPIVGGTYSGTPSDIQVRLIDSSGVEVANAAWASATFAGGTYTHTFSGVAIGGDYRQQVRNTSTGPVTTASQKIYVGGVCYVFARSQAEKLYSDGVAGLAPTAASLVTLQRCTDHTGQAIVSTRLINGVQGMGEGAVAAANRWQSLTTNKPAKIVCAAYSGVAMSDWAADSTSVGDPASSVAIRTGYLHGVLSLAKYQPGVMIFFLSDAYDASYAAELDTVINYIWTLVPTMVIAIAPQIRISSTTGAQVQDSRQSHYDYAVDVTNSVSLAGFALDVQLSDDDSPHQATGAAGNQRWGAYIGQWMASFLFDAGLAKVGPAISSAAFTDGTRNVIEITFDKNIESPDGLTAAREGFWVSGDSGSTFSHTGFTAAITAATKVRLTKTSGSWAAAVTRVEMFRGNPYGTSAADASYYYGTEANCEANFYQKTIFDTTSFESGRGMIARPTMGTGVAVTG